MSGLYFFLTWLLSLRKVHHTGPYQCKLCSWLFPPRFWPGLSCSSLQGISNLSPNHSSPLWSTMFIAARRISLKIPLWLFHVTSSSLPSKARSVLSNQALSYIYTLVSYELSFCRSYILTNLDQFLLTEYSRGLPSPFYLGFLPLHLSWKNLTLHVKVEGKYHPFVHFLDPLI